MCLCGVRERERERESNSMYKHCPNCMYEHLSLWTPLKDALIQNPGINKPFIKNLKTKASGGHLEPRLSP
jgi:hypothetical protein